jgi:hypothetical protein
MTRRVLVMAALAAALTSGAMWALQAQATSRARADTLTLQARVSRLEHRLNALARLVANEPATPAPPSLQVFTQRGYGFSDSSGSVFAEADCPAGSTPTGGGGTFDPGGSGALLSSIPSGNAWGVAAHGTASAGFTTYVVCAKFTP